MELTKFEEGFIKEAVWGTAAKMLGKSLMTTAGRWARPVWEFAKPAVTFGMVGGRGVPGAVGKAVHTAPGIVGMSALGKLRKPAEMQSFGRSALNKGLQYNG